MWLMERMALSQAGLLIQAAFRSWCHVAVKMKQPAWALDLHRDVQHFLQTTQLDPRAAPAGPPPSSGHSVQKATTMAAVATPASCPRSLPSISALVVVVSLLGHVLVALSQGIGGSDSSCADSGDSTPLVDSDNDGIADEVDHCPFTLQQHKFRSTWQTDWDGDGCLDAVEDSDDDNDSVVDAQDLCPHTLSSEQDVHKDGCSSRQRRLILQQAAQASFGTQHLRGKVGEVIFEVVVGTIFTTLMSTVWRSKVGVWAVLRNLLGRVQVYRGGIA